ncbi:MAG: hypothetical protein CUN52_01895 [Phototrophicales bacterium]|nr:MAG: hypothetical protein CUN52_01895 [Phototrophicales bacterium]
MRFRVTIFFLGILLWLGMILVGCQQRQVTQFLMEVTREVTREVTVIVVATDANGQSVSSLPSSTPTLTITPSSTPEIITSNTPAPTPDIFPTPVVAQIIVAEQAFENGRMFYLQPKDEIWVMIYADASGTSGQWRFYPNTWTEGMSELDTSIAPPTGRYQPERGFGKLWRENASVRDALGWALDTEYGHVTHYEFHAGGMIVNNTYVAGPGYHVLTSRDGFNYIFQQSDGTWQRQ